jgi:hypothetical protein
VIFALAIQTAINHNATFLNLSTQAEHGLQHLFSQGLYTVATLDADQRIRPRRATIS